MPSIFGENSIRHLDRIKHFRLGILDRADRQNAEHVVFTWLFDFTLLAESDYCRPLTETKRR